MSRSNYDKPFYVDVGTSIVAVRCASNHDVVLRYDHVRHPHTLKLAEDVCDRMNKEAEVGRPPRNCDRFRTAKEAQTAFDATYFGATDFGFYEVAFINWLFAPMKENGGNKQ